jgi:hypothetical protein
VLTVDIGDRESESHIAREVRTRFASPRNPISDWRRGDRRKSTVGKELPRELEESLTLRAVEKRRSWRSDRLL